MESDGDGASVTVDAGAIELLRVAVPELYRYASRLTGGDRWLAEDLVQEACLAFVRQTSPASSYEFTVGWLVVVVRRRYLDHVRRLRREDRRLSLMRDRDVPVDDADWRAVSGTDALAMLGGLPVDQRVALVLRYVDDLSVQDVADLMERSLTATESLLARGRRQLARRVKGGDRG